MSAATKASKREGMPETWPVETVGGEPIFSEKVRDDLRAGGVVHALEVLADVQAAVYEHLERAYEKLDHEGVRHTVGFTVEHVGASKRDLRKAADLYWMERKEEVEVSEWPYTGITYRRIMSTATRLPGAVGAHQAALNMEIKAIRAVADDLVLAGHTAAADRLHHACINLVDAGDVFTEEALA